MEKALLTFTIDLYKDDVDYLRNEGQKIATIVRKIVSDYVIYHKVKVKNPLNPLPEDKE